MIRQVKVAAALLAGFAVYFCLEVIYLGTRGALVFLTGIPTPGGAPPGIHVFNVAIKAMWSALAYGAVMKGLFGRVAWTRVALLWGFGVLVAGGGVYLASAGTLSVPAAVSNVLRVYVIGGLFLVRDWVARPTGGMGW